MNAFASRGVEGVGFGRVMRKPRLSKRPRAFVAALIGTWVAFMWLVNRYYHKDESTVWIWMGIRSDDRCGRDFGTDHVQHTTCGKGSCCSSHGWCGTSEEYCSVALGCQSGCWKVDAEEQQRIDAKKANGVEDDDEGHHRRYDDDDEHADHNYRYDDYPGSHHDRYSRDRYHHGGGHHHGMDDDEGYHDYNHRYDEGAHEGHGEEEEGHHGDEDEHAHAYDEHAHAYDEHAEHGHHEAEHGHEAHYGDHGGYAEHPDDRRTASTLGRASRPPSYGEHPDDHGHGTGHGEHGAEHDAHDGH